jgi:putative NADH-flavin reductase
MARCLIVGCGCHGRELVSSLRERGHVVRGTTRDPARAAEIEAAGAEAVVADPDRMATLVPALDHVSVAVVLLGSASGPDEGVAALHGPRLEMLLSKVLDTTVRGFVYQAAGSVDAALLREGGELVRRVCEGSRIPYALLSVAPGPHGAWLPEAAAAVEAVLG